MDEGDEYVPQISQLDYSLVSGGQGGLGLQNEPSTMYGAPTQMPMQHLQYSETSMHPCQMSAPMNPQMISQQQVMPGAQMTQQKQKVSRRRKNAANIEQQQAQQQAFPPPQAMMPPSSVPNRQQPQQFMTPMQSMAAMSQNPLMSTHMRPAAPQMQPQMMSGKPPGSEVPQMRHPSVPNVHDPYGQQQQWYQQYRVGGNYSQQQMYPPQRPPMNQMIPQQAYYHQQQTPQDSRSSMYYHPQQTPYGQVPRYPPPMGPPSNHPQQYFPDQSQNYYPTQSHMMQQPQTMQMHQQAPQTTNEWNQQHASNDPQRYGGQPTQYVQNSIQFELQQVQQQLQSMYEIPNRTLQTAQQIEQLQLRLQYLRQCSMNECHGNAQRGPEQPVSVMQRGSEVQVNIKPDVPGHTLISVYHQYPTNSGPTSTTPADTTGKDCVPPEPIPSNARTPVDNAASNAMVNTDMGPTAPGTMMSYGAGPPVALPNVGGSPAPTMPPQQPIYHSVLEANDLPITQPPATASDDHLESQQDLRTDSVSESLNQLGEADIMSEQKDEGVENMQGAYVDDSGEMDLPRGRMAKCEESSMKEDDFGTEEVLQCSKDVTPSYLPREESVTDDIGNDEVDSEKEEASMSAVDDELINERVKMEVEESEGTESHADIENDSRVKADVAQSIETEEQLPESDDEQQKIEASGSENLAESENKDSEKDFENREEVERMKPMRTVKEEKMAEDEEKTEVSTEATTVAQESTAEDEKAEKDEREAEQPVSKPKRKRAGEARKGKRKRRKVEIDDDATPEVDDEEFIPETSKRNRKKARARRREVDSDADAGIEYVEKRRSGRTANAEKKSYDLQAKWEEMDEELGEDSENNQREKRMEEQCDTIIEKIMSVKKNENGPDTYFVKYKNKAYIHCEWKSQEELEAGDKRATAKLKRFLQRRAHSSDQDDEEQFNSDYVIVEKVLDANEVGGKNYVLVKWKSLPYEEVTWESRDIVPPDKISLFEQRSAYDPLKGKPKQRPTASDWRKIPEDTTFKDGNSLREYQFEGVNWLLYCYYNKQNCILADEMGLGKTVQTICFLQKVYDYGIHGPFLVVVPLSTIHNWQREFETWTDMNTIVYHGSAASRNIIRQTEFYYHAEDIKGNRKNVVKFDALITTFEMVVSDCDVLRQIDYHVCIIDEAHRLKNRNCKLLTSGLLSLTAEHRVLLTGTPLQNNIEELYSLLNFLEPEQFHSSSAFLEQFGQCKTEDQVQQLQKILKPMMLRRLKEDVEKTLQPKEETIIEIQLSNTQKKYYRAILERNFSHLCKGTSMPSLMNAMMELRKCCNHPFLINGAEEQILSETKAGHPDWSEDEIYQHALVQSSGKLVLIAKLLPKLRADGHKVLIFSQMVRVLDIIEEFLVAQSYTFERIDGNVRGDLRQSAIDRFSKKDSDRFIFLLCTRAGGLGINLTAADTVIIFDSDWNPQNDLQAQARCHRIGQTKMVKVYRLITCNTYEREMFDKASLKLGLDRAVLQSTTALKDTSQQLSRREIEELLKKGAYGAIMEENNEESKFNEEDIETILLRRTTTITLEAGVKGSTFAKASFNSSTNREDIDIDDPNFWSKWAKKANIDTEMSQTDKELILLEPRNRKKRFEENVYKSEGGDDSEAEESDDSSKGRKRNDRKSDRKRRREDDEYRPDELAFNKSEYFKVEKVLGQFGWGRWKVMREASDIKDSVSEIDIEHISRTLLLHCIREYRGDEKIREFVWNLIIPKGGQVASKANSRKRNAGLTSVFHEGWAALPEYNPPACAVDSSFQRHVHRQANKLLIRIHHLHILNTEVIGSKSEAIMNGAKAEDVDLTVNINEPFVAGWDAECDKCFLIGAHKHGLENVEAIRTDTLLCFVKKEIETFPSIADLLARFRRLLTHFQRKRHDLLSYSTWTKQEEAEFMRVLRSYGVKDDQVTIISWTRFRQLSPLLEKKTDSDLMEQLYCVLSMCTKQLGNDLSAMDLQRAMKVEAISARRAQKLMHRMNMMRQVHDWRDTLNERKNLLKLCSTEAMPSGWTVEHDEELFKVVDEFGLDNISVNIVNRPVFQKIIRPEEKTLLRRMAEIYTTLQTKKWNGTASTELLEESDDERATPVVLRNKRGRKRSTLTPTAGMQDLVDAEKEKLRALAHQSFLQRLEQLPFAAAAAMAQGAILPSLLSGGASSSSASTIAQQAAMLSSLFSLPLTPPVTSSPASTSKTGVGDYGGDVLNLSTKKPSSSSSEQATGSISGQTPNILNNLNITELLALANLPPETRVPVINVESGARLVGDQAPKVKNLGQWLSAHPKYVLDIPSSSSSTSTVPLPPPTSTAAKTSEKDDKPTIAAALDKIIGKKETTTEVFTKEGGLKKEQRPSTASSSGTTTKSSVPALEPGEIPRTVTSTNLAASTSFAGLSLPEQPIAVFQRSTGALVSADKWPTVKTLPVWLDKHPDCNVHSTSASLAATVLPKSYADRVGGDTPVSSASNLESLQMQMMLQQSLMNQALLGLGAYGPLGPYAMLAAASSGSPQSSKSSSSKDVLNPMLASLMNPTLQLQQMQSLLALDPSLLLTQTPSSIASGSTMSSSSMNLTTQSKTTSSSSTSSSSSSSTKKAANKGRLNAVVEKLSSSQS